MTKFEEFKEFCKDKTYLVEKIRQGKTSWQELFEIYDIYGSENEAFKEPEKEEKTEEPADEESSVDKKEESTKNDKKDGLGGILDLIGNFDPDKLADGLNGVKKIIAVLGEVTKPEDNEYVTKRKMTKPYQRSDD